MLYGRQEARNKKTNSEQGGHVQFLLRLYSDSGERAAHTQALDSDLDTGKVSLLTARSE